MAQGPGRLLEEAYSAGLGWPVWAACQIAAAAAVVLWFAARSRGEAARLRVCLVLSFGGAALGAAGLGVIVRLPSWVGSGMGMKALFGGVAAYGALAGLVGAFAGLVRLRGGEVLRALDRLAPCLGAAVVLGRLGCFFAGCDFGAVSSAPWAVRFPAGSPAFADHLARGLVLAGDPRSLPVHPTQIYEALLGACLSLGALAAARRTDRGAAPPGAAIWTATLVYAAGRLALDGLRGDRESSSVGALTVSQWIGLGFLVWGAYAMVLRRVLRRRAPELPPSGRARSCGARLAGVPARPSGGIERRRKER